MVEELICCDGEEYSSLRDPEAYINIPFPLLSSCVSLGKLSVPSQIIIPKICETTL